MEPPDDDEKKKTISIYNKKKYEQNRDNILKYRRERYKKIHENKKNINIIKVETILHFD
jgi:hypothetical protein